MNRRARHLTWPEVASLCPSPLVLVPLGSFEQHGPHLPIDTDTVIAESVCARVAASPALAALRPLALPVLPFGASGEHEQFPGTVSIGSAALTLVLVELVRSLTRWADRVVLITGHGGNCEALAAAVTQLRQESREVAWADCAVAPSRPGTRHPDAHAGHAETSLMLHLDPDRVRLDRAEVGCLLPLREVWPRLRRDGVRAVAANGVLGDPRNACAQTGAELLDDLVARLVEQVRCGNADPSGRLVTSVVDVTA